MSKKVSIRLIKTIDKKKHKDLINFLSSPYFNKNKTILNLCLDIIAYLNKTKDEDFESFYIARNPKAKINVLNKNLSILQKLIFEFIYLEGCKEDKILKIKTQAQYFSDLQNTFFFESKIKEFKQILDQKKNSIGKYEALVKYHNLISAFNSKVELKRGGDLNLAKNIEVLEESFHTSKLYYIFLLMQRNAFLNLKVDFKKHENYLKYFNQNYAKKNNITEILLKAIELSEQKSNLKTARELLDILKQESENIIDKQFIRNIYIILINYSSLYFKNEALHYNFLFEIYLSMLDNAILFKKGKIRAAEITNIVTVALKINQEDWLSNFLTEIEGKLTPLALGKDIYNLSWAKLHFKNKDYDSTFEKLQNINFKDTLYQFAHKRLELMLFYEKEEWLLIDSLINKFRVSISEKRVADINTTFNTVESNRNFINNYSFIFKFKSKQNDYPLEKRKTNLSKLKKLDACTNKEWLTEKYLEML